LEAICHTQLRSSLLSQNLEAHYHIYKSLSLDLILSQVNPLHILPFCFLKSIIFLSAESSKKSLQFWFSNQYFVHISNLMHVTYLPIILTLIILIIGEGYNSSFPHYIVFSNIMLLPFRSRYSYEHCVYKHNLGFALI
jgi:hypothetical protein